MDVPDDEFAALNKRDTVIMKDYDDHRKGFPQTTRGDRANFKTMFNDSGTREASIDSD